jgi:hypothetical protein
MSRSFLVGMLACGENEKDRAIAALDAQDHDDWDFFLIENQPNKAAQDELYRRFMEAASRYHLFLKLDADMVLRRPTALDEITGYFDKNPDSVGVGIDLIDFYSNSLMPCLVCTTDQVTWGAHNDNLMVDSYFRAAGGLLRVSSSEEAVALHSPDPAPLQAFRFGVHRAIKATQNDRVLGAKMLEKAEIHWHLLGAVWNNFVHTGDGRIGLAIAGADFVLSSGSRDFNHDYTHPVIAEVFARNFEKATATELVERLSPEWTDVKKTRCAGALDTTRHDPIDKEHA